jgi:hypothetical protein
MELRDGEHGGKVYPKSLRDTSPRRVDVSDWYGRLKEKTRHAGGFV